MLYLLQYRLSSLITRFESKNTANRLGTAKNNVKASDKLMILLKFIAEPIIMNKQYIT